MTNLCNIEKQKTASVFRDNFGMIALVIEIISKLTGLNFEYLEENVNEIIEL